jgi:hypothetical protein
MIKNIILALSIIARSSSTETISQNQAEIVENCLSENKQCLMKNHFNIGVCNQNLICLECDGLSLSEIAEDKNSCMQMQCQLNSNNIKYGHLVYLMIENCK